jgi:transcription elongation factor GreA
MPATVTPPTPEDEPITAEGLQALEAEVEQLETTGRLEMSKRINEARSLGDLKENADYHIAKEDQAHMETRIVRLRARLKNAVVVDSDSASANFDFGRTAEVLDEETGKTHTWTIVGATEADLAQGRLSGESPVGRALLGAAPGSTVKVDTPRGARTYRVEQVLP